MRLLFVHERYGAFGGAEANVLLTAGELKRRGHSLALLHGAHTGKQEAAWDETFERRFPLENVHATSAAAVRHAVAEFHPDVIFLHKLADFSALEVLAGGGVPVVRMVHDHDLYCLRGYKYHPLTRKICTRAASAYCVFPCGGTIARQRDGKFPLKWVSYTGKRRELALNRRFRRLIVATGFMREELVRNGFAPEQIEIHAPVPRAADAALQCSFGSRNRIVYAGQIIRGKGVDVLLESLARVRTAFECVILGDGNHRAHCEQLAAKLGLGDRVKFTGFVTQEQIQDFYGDASLAVVSSVWPEPFGAVGLEAMRCGLPVVAFDAGGIREWLIDGWNGYLVPWMDRARYAAAIDELLTDKALARKMGAHGRQWVGERFGFPKYISGLEDLFRRLSAEADTPAAETPVERAPAAETEIPA
ncbi:MAG TPA: glycosyltransferase family 4 protein [Opitutaceae bacterium]|nr:glycosyltransferase family 4 protein [Opitutaceae bacterium]